MELKIKSNSHFSWEDEIHFVQYTPSCDSPFSFSFATLSKQKILLNFGNLKSLTELHMFILDNLSKTSSLIFYHQTGELILKLNNNVDLCVTTNWDTLNKIISPCIIKDF